MLAVEALELTKKYERTGKLKSIFMKSPVEKEILAVDKVDLEIKHGELFGLIGSNGAGKTTLTKLLCTLLWPTSGTALINGFDIKKNEDRVKESIGFVSSEERSFYWRLTGRQNLVFFAALSGSTGSDAKEQIQRVIDLTNLDEAADNMVYSYSSGMKQKLSIARGLLTNPRVLFLDEPTKSVDPIATREIKRFIKNELVEGQGMTVLLTSHRLEEIEELCDRFAIINKGQITFCGTIGDLRNQIEPDERYRLRLQRFSQGDFIRVMARNPIENLQIDFDQDNNFCVEFSFPSRSNTLARLISDVDAMGGVLLSCERQECRLEDMFIRHVEQRMAL